MRPPEWPVRLATYIENARAVPFEWGTHDCAGFALVWVAMMRPDLDLSALPRWTSALEAARLIADKPLPDWADAWLERIEPAFARRGDLVLIETGGRESLAICNGECAVGPGTDRLAFIPMTAARAAWRV